MDIRKWINMGIEAAKHVPIEKAYNPEVIQVLEEDFNTSEVTHACGG